MPITRILITNDGKIVVEGIGYIGRNCLEDLAKLREKLKALGVDADIVEQKMKPESGAVVAEEEVVSE